MNYIGDNYSAYIETELTHGCGDLNSTFDISSVSGVSRLQRIPEIEDTVTEISNIFTGEITKSIKNFNSNYIVTGTGPYNLIDINGRVHLKDCDSIRYRNNCYFDTREALVLGNKPYQLAHFKLPVGFLPLGLVEFVMSCNYLIGEYTSGLAIINTVGQIMHKFPHYPVRKGMLALNFINNCLEVIDLLNDSVIYSYLVSKGESVAASIRDNNIIVYNMASGSSSKGNTLSIHTVHYARKLEKCAVCSSEIEKREYILAPCGCNTLCTSCINNAPVGQQCPVCKKIVIRKVLLN
jgi:hypothetical protein